MSSLSGLAGAPSLTKRNASKTSNFDLDFESMLDAKPDTSKKTTGKSSNQARASKATKADSEFDEDYSSYTLPKRSTTANPASNKATSNNIQTAYSYLDDGDSYGVRKRGASGLSKEDQDAEFQKLLALSTETTDDYTATSSRYGNNETSSTRPHGKTASSIIDDVLGLTEDALTSKPAGRTAPKTVETAAKPIKTAHFADSANEYSHTSKKPVVIESPVAVPPSETSAISDWDASRGEESSATETHFNTANNTQNSYNGSLQRSRLDDTDADGDADTSAGFLSDSAFDAAFDAGFGVETTSKYAENNAKTHDMREEAGYRPSTQASVAAGVSSLSILGSARPVSGSLSLLSGDNTAPKTTTATSDSTTTTGLTAPDDNLDTLLAAGRRRRPAAAGVAPEVAATAALQSSPRRHRHANSNTNSNKTENTTPTAEPHDEAGTPSPVVRFSGLTSGERRRMAADLGLDTPFTSPGSLPSPALSSPPPVGTSARTSGSGSAAASTDHSAPAVRLAFTTDTEGERSGGMADGSGAVRGSDSPGGHVPAPDMREHIQPRIPLFVDDVALRPHKHDEGAAQQKVAGYDSEGRATASSTISKTLPLPLAPHEGEVPLRAISPRHLPTLPHRSDHSAPHPHKEHAVHFADGSRSPPGPSDMRPAHQHSHASYSAAEVDATNAVWSAKMAAMQANHEAELSALRARMETKVQDGASAAEANASSTIRTLQNRMRTLEAELIDAKSTAERRVADLMQRMREEADSAASQKAAAAVSDARQAWESEKAALEKRHADETSFLRRVHSEELDSWRARLKDSSEVNILAAQVRAATKSLEEVQQRVAAEALGSSSLRAAQLDARERLLLDLEIKAKAASQRSEDEARRLQTLLSTIESSMATQRRELDDDRTRLQAEHMRVSAWQAVVAGEADAHRKMAAAERQELLELRQNIEKDRRHLLADTGKLFRDAQSANDEANRVRADALAEAQRISSDGLAEKAALQAAIESLRREHAALLLQKDEVAAEIRRLQAELSLSAVEKANLEASRTQLEGKLKDADEKLAAAQAAREECKRDRAAADDTLVQAEQARLAAAGSQQAAEAERATAQAMLAELADQRRSLAEERAALSRERQSLLATQRNRSVVHSAGAALHLPTDDNGLPDSLNSSFSKVTNSFSKAPEPLRAVSRDGSWPAAPPLPPPSVRATAQAESSRPADENGQLDRTSLRKMLTEWQQDSAKATEALLSDHEKLMRSLAARGAPLNTLASSMSSGNMSTADSRLSSDTTSRGFNATMPGATLRRNSGLSDLEAPVRNTDYSSLGHLDGTLASLTRLSDAHSI